MRITFDIDANDLKRIQKITRQKKKSPAIRRALADYLRMWERRAFVEKMLTGGTDYPLTNDELEAGTFLERNLRARGFIVPRNDLFVATVAIRTGLVLLCRDARFDAMRKIAGETLKVEQV